MNQGPLPHEREQMQAVIVALLHTLGYYQVEMPSRRLEAWHACLNCSKQWYGTSVAEATVIGFALSLFRVVMDTYLDEELARREAEEHFSSDQ